ncbi:M15 family metallopeptidase [Anaeromicrobium sediminis]|uniref:Peptidase M15C domain-containing protein n=1 Tax=Anaeromicrobium sediminis TaxID=1478221 RepID=A0A267MLC8_9FIRM|nr:M15 family metallopeptidase [Anaeromicrobium sediminis]PAB59603.1 hypothetical protein CCE28_08510 [Anaeromicrobium sediminis]
MFLVKKAIWSILLVFIISTIFFTMGFMFEEKVEGVQDYLDTFKETEEIRVDNHHINKNSSKKTTPQPNHNKFEPVFSYSSLSEENIRKIKEVSWKPSAPVSLEELSYVKVTYWGFDDREHVGELIVHEKVAEEVVEIFEELYKGKFPIERIKLIDEYGANDDLSMEDNNTSSFCFRVVSGSKKLSKHSYGIAIDINPLQNPYVKGDKVSPKAGKEYLDRNNVRMGMIIKDDICYKAFKSKGWIWGGDWKTVKDYQHFQKDIHVKELK